VESAGVEEVEVCVGDEAADLKNVVYVGLETGHLFVLLFIVSINWVVLLRLRRRARWMEVHLSGIFTSQSIQTKGSVERVSAISAALVCARVLENTPIALLTTGM
jgi:hypothetical protein